MNKFSLVLKYIKKYVFWVISLVCLLTTIIVGNIVTGSKSATFEARESAIESRFSEMQRLAGQDNPNGVVVAQKQEDVENLKANIFGVWNRLYAPQSTLAEHHWPEFRGDVNADYYQDELRNAWNRQSIYDTQNTLLPEIASAYREYVTRSQARDLMERYRIYIPQLAVGANDAMTAALPTGVEKATESELPSEGCIIWDETNRQQLFSRFSRFLRAKAGGIPTRNVFIVQEDLWAYDILLDAIAKMNASCEGAHDAVVKRIFEVNVADDASSESLGGDAGGYGNRENRSASASGKEGPVVFRNSADRVVMVEEPAVTGDEELDDLAAGAELEEETESVFGDDDEFEELFNYRYCDMHGNFMPATRLVEYLKTKPEYKMMPVHVRILINQEQIPQFMLNCMNSELPIYIHQISVKVRDFDSIAHKLEIVPEEKPSSEEESVGTSSRASRGKIK